MNECIRTCIESSGASPLVALGLVAVAIIPTIATALTRYPQAAGILSTLSGVLDRLSVLAHHDAPGSLKVPGKRSVNPNGKTKEAT